MTKSKSITKKSSSAKHTIRKPGSKKLKAGEQKILDIVAALKTKLGKETACRKQVFSSAGLGKSTFANALTTLKVDLLDVTPKFLSITEKGMEQADPTALEGTIATTNDDHHKKVKEHHKLKPNEIALIDQLVDGKVHDKKEVAATIGMKTNSTWSNMLTDLKKLSIITYKGKSISLHDDMFPFGRP